MFRASFAADPRRAIVDDGDARRKGQPAVDGGAAGSGA
jgi:hypothetical protein